MIDDLQTVQRWPIYRARALELGVRSMLSYRLHARGQSFGALDFYSKRPNVYSLLSASSTNVSTSRRSRPGAVSRAAIAVICCPSSRFA